MEDGWNDRDIGDIDRKIVVFVRDWNVYLSHNFQPGLWIQRALAETKDRKKNEGKILKCRWKIYNLPCS